MSVHITGPEKHFSGSVGVPGHAPLIGQSSKRYYEGGNAMKTNRTKQF